MRIIARGNGRGHLARGKVDDAERIVFGIGHEGAGAVQVGDDVGGMHPDFNPRHRTCSHVMRIEQHDLSLGVHTRHAAARRLIGGFVGHFRRQSHSKQPGSIRRNLNIVRLDRRWKRGDFAAAKVDLADGGAVFVSGEYHAAGQSRRKGLGESRVAQSEGSCHSQKQALDRRHARARGFRSLAGLISELHDE